MPGPLTAGIRLGGIIIALALMLQFLQPASRVFAQGITVTPVPPATSFQPGTSVRVDGAGFANGETVTLKFDTASVTTTPATIMTSNPGGTFSGATFTIPLAATNGPHTVTATGSTGDHATSNLVVGPNPPPNPAISITKTADGVSCGPGQCAANVGEVLTYGLSVQNSGGATTGTVTVSDTLQLGQTYLSATASVGTCSTTNNNDGTVTVNCSLGPLAAVGLAGSTATVTIRAQVNGTQPSISNTAYAGPAGTGVTATSNTTVVTVVGRNNCTTYPCNNPCYPYAAGTCNPNPCGGYNCNPCGGYNCNPCGGYNCNPCGGYNCNPCGAYSCNTCGAYSCNTCGTCNPYPTTGCGTCNTNPTGCNTGCNPCGSYCNGYYGAPTYCGVVTAYTPAGYNTNGSVYMGSSNYPVAAGTTFPGVQVTPGQYYCFLYGTNQYITGCLSILPTGLDDGGSVMVGREIMD